MNLAPQLQGPWIGSIVVAAGLTGASTTAHADPSFFSEHNLGITYEIGHNYAQLSYDAPLVGNVPQQCVNDQFDAGHMRCAAYLSDDANDASGISIYIEAPFKRQGLFYFEPGLTFSTVEYQGTLAGQPTGPTNKNSGPPPTQPLTQASMELYGVDLQAYLRVGITPPYIPDIFVSAGLGLQMVGGRIKVLTQDDTHFVAQPEAFAEVEAVLLRYKTGSLSVFYGQDQSLTSQFSANVIGDNPSGSNLTNFQVGLSTASTGVRLLFPF